MFYFIALELTCNFITELTFLLSCKYVLLHYKCKPEIFCSLQLVSSDFI